MSRRINCYTVILFILFRLTTSSVVLPRPPSSANHIHQDQNLSMREMLEGKALHSVSRETNVKRPNTEDYRLLEIELQSANEIEATNLQGLVHAMLKQKQIQQTSSLSSHLEIIPHSILGVHNVGFRPNYRLEGDKRTLLDPTKLRNFGEKLYYVKNDHKPKVYVNVRGHSGSFHKKSNLSITTPKESPVGFITMTRSFERQTADWKARDKKSQSPKRSDRHIDSITIGNKKMDRWMRIGAQETSSGIDKLLSTTEDAMVTSSELPKQIPAPPSKIQGKTHSTAQTTPVQRYALSRTDILPGYGFIEE